jgi:hypothetical protein
MLLEHVGDDRESARNADARSRQASQRVRFAADSRELRRAVERDDQIGV